MKFAFFFTSTNFLVKLYHLYVIFFMSTILLYVLFLRNSTDCTSIDSKSLNVVCSFLLVEYNTIVGVTLPDPLHSALKLQVKICSS